MVLGLLCTCMGNVHWEMGTLCGLCGRISYANIMPLIAYPHDWCVLLCQSRICGWPNEGIDLPAHAWELTLRWSCFEASSLITKSRMGRRAHKTGPRWTYGLTQSEASRRVGVSRATVKVILLSNPTLTTAASLVQLVIWLVSYKVLFVSSG